MNDGAFGRSATPARMSWRWLLVSPHRLFFALGAANLAIASAWWLIVLGAPWFGWQPTVVVPRGPLHAYTLLYGVFPLFMFGFLFTTGPTWLAAAPVPIRRLVAPAIASALAVPLALAGASRGPGAVAFAAIVAAAGWFVLLVRLALLDAASRATDRVHFRWTLRFFFIGWGTLGLCAAGFAAEADALLRAAQTLAVWCFVAPVIVTVAHRMLPVLSAVAPRLDESRPLWLLVALNAALVAHGGLTLADAALPRPPWAWLQLAVDVAGAILVFAIVRRWIVLQNLRNRLLAMLCVGIAWLGVAFALGAFAAWARATAQPELAPGLAPLHALTMGFFTSVLVAMGSRVIAARAGRARVADDFVAAVYVMLQFAVVARCVADIAPASAATALLLAIGAWCAALVPWSVRSLAILLRPRADGRTG